VAVIYITCISLHHERTQTISEANSCQPIVVQLQSEMHGKYDIEAASSLLQSNTTMMLVEQHSCGAAQERRYGVVD
jgi:hypothetical protein